MTVGRIVLTIHLYLGLAAAVFLVILGLTGSIMAFEVDINHWLHPSLWYVTVAGRVLPEGELIQKVERQVAPARIAALQISPRRNQVWTMQLTDRSTVMVNPYDGMIQGRATGPSRTQRVLGYIHQIHLRLASDPRSAVAPAGKMIVSYAALVLCFLAPTGWILWWRTKRGSIHWNGSLLRLVFDIHNVVGIYAGLFLWIAAFTGVLIGFDFGEQAIYSLTHSARPERGRPPQSAFVAGATPIGVDRAIEAARQALPDAFLEGIVLPRDAKATFIFIMRVPEETSGIPHSDVLIDQYTGKPLQIHNFLTDSQGYRWIRFNRSIHTGDIGGLPGRILVSLSSLLLAVMVGTGLIIWWKKLAI